MKLHPVLRDTLLPLVGSDGPRLWSSFVLKRCISDVQPQLMYKIRSPFIASPKLGNMGMTKLIYMSKKKN